MNGRHEHTAQQVSRTEDEQVPVEVRRRVLLDYADELHPVCEPDALDLEAWDRWRRAMLIRHDAAHLRENAARWN